MSGPRPQPQRSCAGILLRADLVGTLDRVTRVAARRDGTLAGRVTLITFGMQEAGSYFVRTWMGPHASELADLHLYLHRTDWLYNHTTRLPQRGTYVEAQRLLLDLYPFAGEGLAFCADFIARDSTRHWQAHLFPCAHGHHRSVAQVCLLRRLLEIWYPNLQVHVYHLDHTSATEVDRMSHDDHEEYLQEPLLRLWMNPPATLLHDWRHR